MSCRFLDIDLTLELLCDPIKGSNMASAASKNQIVAIVGVVNPIKIIANFREKNSQVTV